MLGMQLTPATSSRGAGRLLPVGGVRAGSCLHMPEDDDAPSSLPQVSATLGAWVGRALRAGASSELSSTSPHPLRVWSLGSCRCPARCRAAHAATTGTVEAPELPPRDPPGRSRGPSKCLLMLPQEQPLGSPRLSAAPSLQLVRSAGFLLPRYGFGFNNS